MLESWGGLPESVKSQVRARRFPDPRSVMNEVDFTVVSGEELEARRRCVKAWGDDPSFIQALQFLYSGRTRVQDFPNLFPELIGRVDPTYLLLCDVDTLRWLAAGESFAELVTGGRVTEFHPIADPFGKDSDEYEARLDAWVKVDRWINELGELRSAGASVGGDAARELRKRKEMSPAVVLENMNEEGVLA